MSLLDRLERNLGRYALPNVTLWLVAGQALFYLATHGPNGDRLYERLAFVPGLVLEGQVWRLLFYPLTPPGLSPIWVLIYLAAFYYFGSAVESIWGTFRYNLYLLTGFVLTGAAAFAEPGWAHSSHYVESSVFLAFAALLPDAVIRIYFILPVKARYLAALTWALYAIQAYFGTLSTRLMIAAAVGNFFLFLWPSAFASFKQARRRRSFQRRTEAGKRAALHECRVCGLTSGMSPRTAFRYCSRCAGQCCYCPDHIRDHEHVTE